MGTDRLGRQHISWLTCFLVYACFYFSLLPPAQAEQTNHNRDNQKREAVRHAIELAQPNANARRVANVGEGRSGRRTLADRPQKPPGSSLSIPSMTSTRPRTRARCGWSFRAILPWGPMSSYGFESSDSLGQSSEKFNRLLSHLALSVPNDKAASIARLFLGCCVRDTYGETVSDEGVLRHTVERYYIRIYGDVWRGLEAYTQWWQAYQKEAVPLPPTVVVDAGVRRITLARLILGFGMHPQLERWEIAVSSDGSVRVLAVDSVFPKQSRWLSYAFRSTVDPRIH